MIPGIVASEGSAGPSVESPVKYGSAKFQGFGNLQVTANFLPRSWEASASFSGAGNMTAVLTRLGVFVPTDLATLAGWWDASDTDTLTDAGSGHCSQWDDKSANANHVTQGTDGNRPIITASGLDGKTTLTFSATKYLDVRTTTGFPDLTAGMGFGIISLATNVTNRGLWDISDTTTTTNRTAFVDFGSSEIVLRSQNANPATIAYTDTVNAHLLSGTISTTLRDVYLDGTQGTSNSTTQANLPSTNIRFGLLWNGGNPFLGQIAELVFFSGADATSRQKVEGYLAWKWGLEGNLPVGHPYKYEAP